MNKEDILNKSREENKKKDYYELELDTKASNLGALVMLFLTLIFYILEIALKGNTNYGLYALICIFNGVIFTYKGIKTRKTLRIITGVIWFIATCICSAGYIYNIITTSTIL